MSSLIRSLTLVAVVFASFGFAQQASAQEVRLQARLTGASLASGKATFRQKGTLTRLSVEVEDAVPNTALTITALRGTSTIIIGSFTTDAFGFADLNRAGANAATLQVGDIVMVCAGTTKVVVGTMVAKR